MIPRWADAPDPPHSCDDLLTAGEVQARFGVSPPRLMRWIRAGLIAPMRVTLPRGTQGSDLRFVAGDVAQAIERSERDEDRGDDPAMG